MALRRGVGCSRTDPKSAPLSRGYIVPIGGAEEKLRDAAILKRFIAVCGGEKDGAYRCGRIET